MTDEAPAPVPLTPSRLPIEIKQKAYDLIVKEGKDIIDTAIELSLPRATVSAWSVAGKWASRRQELTAAVVSLADSKMAEWTATHKQSVAENHLVLGTQAERVVGMAMDKIEEKLKNNEHVPTMDLERLTKALAAGTSVTARAVGLSDQPAPIAQDANKQGAKTLIVLNVNPTLPPGREVDVTQEVTVESP